MPTPPKSVDVRFHNVDQILAAIDATKLRVIGYREAAIRADTKADKLVAKLNKLKNKDPRVNPEQLSAVVYHRDRAERKRQRAVSIEQSWLPRLKAKLAVIQTDLLPGIGFTDKSIKQ
jgi:hypothetical protein